MGCTVYLFLWTTIISEKREGLLVNDNSQWLLHFLPELLRVHLSGLLLQGKLCTEKSLQTALTIFLALFLLAFSGLVCSYLPTFSVFSVFSALFELEEYPVFDTDFL